MEFFRITQEFDEFLYFILCFLNPGDIAKCDFIFVARKHARFRFSEIERAFPRHADLLAKKKVKYEEKKSDREKTNHGLRKHV